MSDDLTKTELPPRRLQIVDGEIRGLDPDWAAAFRDSRVALTLPSGHSVASRSRSRTHRSLT